MGGDAADRAVQQAAGAEQSDQPSAPAKASGGDAGSGGSSGRTGSGSGGRSSGGSGTSVTMPALGESVTEGTVTRWLKSVGDTVEVDEPLLEVSTDKVDTEIPSPVAGTLLSISADEDETAVAIETPELRVAADRRLVDEDLGHGPAARQIEELLTEGGIVVERDLMAPARDGVLLATDIYLPPGSGPFPVLLERIGARVD